MEPSAREQSPDERAAKRVKIDALPSVESETPSGQNGSHANGGEQAAEKPQGGDVAMADAPKGESGQDGPVPEVKKDARDRNAAIAPIKAEFLIPRSEIEKQQEVPIDDDAAEGRGQDQEQQERGDHPRRDTRDKRDKKKAKGQNKERTFGNFDDTFRLCNSRAYYPEFSPRECRYGDRCQLSHDLRKYMEEGRRGDVETFGGKCPVFESHGRCPSGWKCRFVRSHMKEVEREDGRKELVLLGASDGTDEDPEDARLGSVNVIDNKVKIDLSRRRVNMEEVDKYISWMNHETKLTDELHHRRNRQTTEDSEDLRAQYREAPLKPSEKRKLYFGRDTPALAPLTTQGNLPFRRLAVELGAELTYSEMAMGLPLIQGTKADWTLLKAHESELVPPKAGGPIVQGYDNAKDIKFGAQISANQPWVAVKAAECLKRFVPHLRVIDLNCGCPIDMLFKAGGGSALLEAHGKLERMVRGMNTVSGEIPVTVKIRTGVRSNRPTATSIINKLAFGVREHRERLGAPGCAAITLHGRSREQRYTRRADWSYVAECAALIKSYNETKDADTDTIREPDASTLPNSKDGKMYFLGNGDCYSHVEYFDHIDNAGVDSVMIGRGALVKPWLFEEIEKGQYLDKTATERLGYIEKFVRYGLEAWGSDELGIGFTRRFLLEWMSFTHRYVPLGILEHLPPSLNDRPPAFRGRNEMETLLASNNYKDWIKISEMYLGPCHPGFTFQPKHKSNAYEAEG
ncbi:hypothetical protein VDGE_06058 [Verticillium dahliae]|uniref:tRNA-dihydrouridine(47) synthase [NAD(P)(+)] n=1 Tax=Verticillium dahliae TaxID=27337 RepID=A0A444S0F7_VERDA|nr:hypothetical protein VDGE_06058 [Verticillium dahliae]